MTTTEYSPFEHEEKVIAEAKQQLSETRSDSATDLGELLKEYERLFRQFRRIVRISDRNEAEVREANAKIQSQNAALEAANDELKRAQAELVQAGKMAALGQLVTGVAHEINTPLGISVTTASQLAKQLRALNDKLSSGKIKRSDLERYVATAAEGHEILGSNMRRAGDLVQSFKKVAVDRAQDDPENFDLKTCLDDTIMSLSGPLRKSGATVALDCPAGLHMFGFPGAISQIVTNLVMNSLIHGFDSPGGEISLTAEGADRDHIRMTYSDDGRGMDDGVKAKIFDPFFTTRRGDGGSGLGMHIVFNIVTAKMNGKLNLDTAPGEGVTFTIEIPNHVGDS